MLRAIAGVLALATGILTVSPARAAAAPRPDIHVSSCQVLSGAPILVPRSDDIGVAVRFTYRGAEPLAEIVWRVSYAATKIDVIDDGKFSSDVRIDSFALAEQGSQRANYGTVALNAAMLATGHFAGANMLRSTLTMPLYASLPNPENCAVVRAVYASGAVWVNPDLDQQPALLPQRTPVPAAVRVPLAKMDGPVEITHCWVDIEGISELNVTFRTTPDAVADRIVFRAAYGSSAIEFADTDTADLENDVYLKHRLRGPRADPKVRQSYVSLDDPHDCAVVSVHYTDGTAWQNPALAAAPDPLPTPVPDAMALTLGIRRWSPRHGFPTPLPVPSASPTG